MIDPGMPTYTERQHLPYAAEQLYDLVSDVERYPEFLPWVADARIRRRRDHTILVGMTLVAGPLRKSFSSIGVLDRPYCIDISSDDPIFDHFVQRWRFESLASGGTDVEYHLDVKFRSRLMQMLIGATFANRASATVAAFKRRADRLYGRRF